MPSEPIVKPALSPPIDSRMRWWVLLALCGLSFLTIVDRVSISAAKNDIASDLSVSDQSFGFVFGAFALGYALFMVPSGWAADRLGPRRFLAIIVAAWSIFTIGTGLALAVPMLIAIRFLFGGAEAGAYPTAARAIYSWLPTNERGLALGLLNTGSRLGAAIGLSLMSGSIVLIGWRASFITLGILGLLWAAWWFWWHRDQPEQKGGAAPNAEPQRSLLTKDAVFVVLQYFCSNFTFFLCFSWLLPYMREAFHLPAQQAALFASVPLYCGALATWTSGLTVDALFRRGHWDWSRRVPAMAGFSLAAICLLAATRCTTVLPFVLCFSLTTFGVDFTLSPSWSASSDLGGRRTGMLSASMNMLGSAGAFASSVVFPWLLHETHSVFAYFALAAALDVAAVFLWLRVRVAPR